MSQIAHSPVSPASPGSLLEGVRQDAPALDRALDVSERVVAVGFEWDTVADVWAQVQEEIAELQEAYAAAPRLADGRLAPGPEAAAARHEVELELGDVLFSLVNIGRKLGLSAEDALHATCDKFTRRWMRVEQLAAERDLDVRSVDRDELEELWRAAKRIERSEGSE